MSGRLGATFALVCVPLGRLPFVAMKLLWLATKPPLPPVDGGRLLQLRTLEELGRRGVEVTLVSPPDSTGEGGEIEGVEVHWARPAPRRPPVWRWPLAVARHRHRGMERLVNKLLGSVSFDAVHVEQVHALPQARPALERGLPVVLRAQNVESDLWRGAARRLPGVRGAVARLEAARFARWEGRAIARATRVAALTETDAARLRELAADHPTGETSVTVVPAPFPGLLPAGEALSGSPSVVLVGSSGWLPNRDSTDWFLEEIWPAVAAAQPAARLHLFGEKREVPSPSVTHHGPLADSRAAFAADSVLVVPLRIASGVRMKILEAWARGVPVVATAVAAGGLGLPLGEGVLRAEDGPSFAAALGRLQEPSERNRLVEEGRRHLAARHDPGRVAERLLELYSGKVSASAGPEPGSEAASS
ncbi:MAG: glycosyltransferase [Acidobacteriota bacterium]